MDLVNKTKNITIVSTLFYAHIMAGQFTSSTRTAVAMLVFLPFIHQTTGILVVPHEIEGNFDEFLHTLVKVLLELEACLINSVLIFPNFKLDRLIFNRHCLFRKDICFDFLTERLTPYLSALDFRILDFGVYFKLGKKSSSKPT